MRRFWASKVLVVVCSLVTAGVAAAAAIAVQYYASDDTLLRMGSYTFEGGKTLTLTVGIGSGAFRHASDPPHVLRTIGDRGPNIACDEMPAIAGVAPLID